MVIKNIRCVLLLFFISYYGEAICSESARHWSALEGKVISCRTKVCAGATVTSAAGTATFGAVQWVIPAVGFFTLTLCCGLAACCSAAHDEDQEVVEG